MLAGAIGLAAEGMFEWRALLSPFLSPPSTPGQSKIIEHFLLQHVLFVCIGFLFVFRPAALRTTFQSIFVRFYLGALALAVTLPELIVSFKSDLFRPYPFELRVPFLKAIQMISFSSFQVNVLQVQHLLFAHFALMGGILAICLRPQWLRIFFGPRTGGE
jgi:hypothetical protein